MADKLREVVRVGLPSAYTAICHKVGKTAVKDIKEVIIGRTTPMRPLGPYGGWEPLKAVTVMLKRRRGGGRGGNPYTILYDSGRLHQSIEYKITGPKSVAVGTDVEYAEDQEYGNPAKNTPARPFLGPGIYLAAVTSKTYMHKVFGEALNGKKVR